VTIGRATVVVADGQSAFTANASSTSADVLVPVQADWRSGESAEETAGPWRMEPARSAASDRSATPSNRTATKGTTAVDTFAINAVAR
jgi:hypothetical protein